MSSDTKWYYAKEDQQFGPVSSGELRQLAAAGGLLPDDLLWREGMEEWAPAVSLKGLFQAEQNAQGSGVSSPIRASSSSGIKGPILASTPATSVARTITPAAKLTSSRSRLTRLLFRTQAFLWGICTLVILIGGIVFSVAYMRAKTPAEEQAASVIFVSFAVTTYIIARIGEKISRLILETYLDRRR